MLKLKLQYFGHLMRRTDSLEETLMLGKIERRRRGQQRMKWLVGISDVMEMSMSRLQELVMDKEAWGATVHGVTECVCVCVYVTKLNWIPKVTFLSAAAAKSLQLYPTLCNPIDSRLPGSPISGILQARTLEWVAISFSNAWKWKVKVKLVICV